MAPQAKPIAWPAWATLAAVAVLVTSIVTVAAVFYDIW